MSNLFTLVYFQPSAEGYDYTDGFISSDDEISVNVFLCPKEAGVFMAKENAKVYNIGRLNKPTYQHISTPEYSFTLLVNGHTQDSVGSFEEWGDETSARYDQYQGYQEDFRISYGETYSKLVEEYKAGKKAKDDAANRKLAMFAAEKRYSEYERLKKEFE